MELARTVRAIGGSAAAMCGLTLCAFLCAPAVPVRAQDAKTASLVSELVKALDAAKANSIAAPHPGGPDQFIGCLYFQGSQLLVVTAKYSAPQLLTAKIAEKAYQDIYIDLNSASIPNTKIFISDLGADGLKSKRRDNEAFDTVEMAGKTVAFDGDWGKAKISEKDYMSTFSSAEDEYAKMLQALLTQIKKPS